ncbi:MAG: hypothetical protein K2G26_03715, partial [Clostridia bacterium]|nr:hypothetical protein [Clostridia bacterium]
LNCFMSERGFCFLCRANHITQKVLAAFPENVLIYSMWKGYLDKSHPAYDEYKGAFIEKAIENGSRLVYLHTSGHASVKQIKQICEITSAKVIIPIHSEKPEDFSQLGISGEVRFLQDGEKLLI